MVSLPAMSVGDWFCFSRNGRIGGGGWVHPKGANSMAMSRLGYRNDLAGYFCPFWHKQVISPCRPPFPVFKACFSATAGWHFLTDVTRCLLISGCSQSPVSAKDG